MSRWMIFRENDSLQRSLVVWIQILDEHQYFSLEQVKVSMKTSQESLGKPPSFFSFIVYQGLLIIVAISRAVKYFIGCTTLQHFV